MLNHKIWILTIYWLFFILGGCTSHLETKSTAVQEVITVENVRDVIIPEKATITVQPVIESTSPTATLGVSPQIFMLCSPLEEQNLGKLSEIVSSPYDPPPVGKDDRHQGVDFAYYNRGERKSIEGEIVQSILPGKVVTVIDNRLPYGNSIVIETSKEYLPPELIEDLGLGPDESLYSLYAHLIAPINLSVGKHVLCADPLGQVGSTGYNIPVAHLHLETRIGPADYVIGIMAFYDTQATSHEMDAYRVWRVSGTFRHFDPMVLFTDRYFDPIK